MHRRRQRRQAPHSQRPVRHHGHGGPGVPDLEAFAQHPYDPLLSARASGHILAALLRRPPRQGWPRVVAFLVAGALLSGAAIALGVMSGLLPSSPATGRTAAGLHILLITGFPGLLGGVLLWRLLRYC